MTRYLLTPVTPATELWVASETNPAYAQDLTTRATVAKNAAGTYFKYRPGVTVSATGDFPAIANAKSGWVIGTAILGQYTNAGSLPLYSTYNRRAQHVTLNAVIGTVRFRLAKTLSPTGTVYARIRKVSDDSILATSATTLNVADMGAGAWYDFPFANVSVNEAVYVSVEYNGGDSSNYVSVYRIDTDQISGCIATYTTSWSDTTDQDLCIEIFLLSPLTGSFAAGNWTFTGALYNQTKYGHAVKIAVRLSRSTAVDGSNATIIGAVTENTTTTTLAGTAGNIQTFTWTYDPDVVTLTNEYLFVEFRCVIVTAASNAAAEHSFIVNEDPATRDESVTPTTFTPGGEEPPVANTPVSCYRTLVGIGKQTRIPRFRPRILGGKFKCPRLA